MLADVPARRGMRALAAEATDPATKQQSGVWSVVPCIANPPLVPPARATSSALRCRRVPPPSVASNSREGGDSS